MSELLVTSIYNQEGTGAPNLPKGAVVTGVITATTLKGDAEITGGTINATSVTAASGTFNGPVTIGGTLTYEDVTNIDSVGVITARQGIKVTGGGINVSSGVITATSFVGSGANLTDIDALPSVSGTASGSITAGNAVMIKTDGNYEAVTGVNETLGAKSATFSQTYFMKSAFDPTSGKFVIVYGDPANGYNPYSSVATISNTNTVSYGTKAVIEATNLGNVGLDVCYVANRDKMVCVHRNGGSGIGLERGTISGTDITWDNRVTITGWGSADSLYQTIAYNPDNNLIAVAYRSGSSGSNNPYLVEFSMASNGTIAATGHVVLSNNTNEQIDIAYDTANDFYVIFYKNSFQSNQGAITVAQSGNGTGNPTTGSGGNYVYTSGGVATTGNVLVYDPDTAQCILFYQQTTDDNPYIMTAKYAGNGTTNAWTFGTKVQVAADGQCVANSLGITYNSTIKKVVVTWQSSATDKVYVRTLKVSGTGFVLDDTVEVNDDYGMYGACSFDTTNHKVLVSYSNDDSNQDSYSSAYVPTNTNLSADTYIGLANNTVTNGQTVKVNTASNISTQSGLTTATKYYVSATGGISNTAASPSVMAGIALNSTQLLIKSA